MRTSVVLTSLLAAATLSLTAATASAQATRTWVSGVGDDANPCSRTAPCKTFAGAISKTAAGGEIDAIDPGGFGAVTISKGITIDAHNVMGGVLVASTNAFVISAGPNDVVTLRGLSITATPTTPGLAGVSIISAGAVHVEDCLISNYSTAAIRMTPASGTTTLYVKHSTLSENAAGIIIGGAGTMQATIVKSTFSNNPIGLQATDTARVTIHESVFTGSSGDGVNTGIALLSQNSAEINMDHGLISLNTVGVLATSTVRLSEVMLGHNTTGLSGAKVASFGNNRVQAGNGTNGAPSTTLPQQ